MRFCRLMSNFRRVAIAVGLAIGSCGAVQAGVVGTFTNGNFTWPNAITPVYTGPSNVSVELRGTQFAPGGPQFDGLNNGGAFSWSGHLHFNSPSYDQIYSTVPNASTGLVTFCLELNQDIGQFGLGNSNGGSGPYSYNISNDIASAPLGAGGAENMGASAAGYIAELWKNHLDGGIDFAGALSSVGAGAMQLAIWKLEYDYNNSLASAGAFTTGGGQITNVNFNVGNFLVTNPSGQAALNLATQWLKELTTPTAGNEANLLVLTSASLQDQIFENTTGVNPNAIHPIPEPASIVMWLLAGSAVGCVGLRRRRMAAGVSSSL